MDELLALVDSLDNIPKELHGLYAETPEKKFQLKVNADSAVQTFGAGLVAAKTQILDEKKKVDAELKAFRDLGFTTEEIAQIKADKEKAELAKLTADQRAEKATGDMAAKHTAELEKRTQREGFLTKQLEKNLVEARAIDAISKAEGKVKALLPHVVGSLKMVEEGEGDNKQFVVRVMAGDQPRYADSVGNYMSIEALVEELKKDPEFAGNFKASSAGGSGAPANQARTTGAGSFGQRNREDMSATDKIAQGLAQRSR